MSQYQLARDITKAIFDCKYNYLFDSLDFDEAEAVETEFARVIREKLEGWRPRDE